MNELFFIALYLLSFSSPLISPHLLPASAASPAVPAPPKPSVFLSPWSAGAMELARANKMDSTIPWVLVIVSAPIMAGKQLINVVQLVKASRWLTEGDARARARARSGKKN